MACDFKNISSVIIKDSIICTNRYIEYNHFYDEMEIVLEVLEKF